MIGVSSNSAGILLLPKAGTGTCAILDIVEGEEHDPISAQYLYSAVQDWKEIEGSSTSEILDAAIREYWIERAVSLLRLAIGGIEQSLEKRMLEHVEEILSSRVSSEEVLDRLLIAPLKDPRSPSSLSKSALSNGYATVASILDELVDLQPLLHRFTDLWLDLEETSFSIFQKSRELIWKTIVEKCGIKQFLKADSGYDFKTKWNCLAFVFRSAHSRIGIAKLGKEISQRLFLDEEKTIEFPLTDEMVEAEPTFLEQQDHAVNSHLAFERAKKQISAIAKAVSQGRDSQAKKYLRELIQDQISTLGGEKYALKSLCNIAKRCADMFRMDFEGFCLDKARQINSYDVWTLVQYGDHLKRIGRYEEALKVLAEAEKYGHSHVAKSCIADVYSQQGEYVKAIKTFETVPNYTKKHTVLTAIADNLRRMGRMEDAQQAYTDLIKLARQGFLEYPCPTIRAETGIAEISKRRGNLEEALDKYYSILDRGDIDERDRIFYKLGLCNVLKLMGEYDEAYSVVDEIIQQYPFAMEARFIRGSILGLFGREQEGLEDTIVVFCFLNLNGMMMQEKTWSMNSQMLLPLGKKRLSYAWQPPFVY